MMPQDEKVTPKNASDENSPADGEEGTPNFKGLKMLVIALGIAIVGMLGLIVYTISQRAAEGLLGDQAEDVEQVVVADRPVADYLNFNIERPKGGQLVSVTAEGAELIFHFRSEAGDTVITLDRRTGAQSRVDIP